MIPARLGQTPVTFLLGSQANRCVLQSHRQSFSQQEGWDWIFGRPSVPPNLLTMDDPPHAWHRRLLHPAFAVRRLPEYLPRITVLVERRLSTWAPRRAVDIYEEARLIACDVAADVLLGLHAPAERALCRAVYLYNARHRQREWDALIRRAIAERRACPRDDVIGLLACAQDEHGRPALDEAQIRAHAAVVLIAGHETTASLASWALFLLVQYPSYARLILDELDRHGVETALPVETLRHLIALDWLIDEAERLYPPVPVAPRVVRMPVECGGHMLMPGTRVFYSAAATHLLPSLWSAPARFDPERFAPPREEHKRAPYALIGFGGGPRTCIGRTVARATLAVFLTQVLRRYRLAILPGQPLVQRWGVTNRPQGGLRMAVQPCGRVGL